MTDKNNINKIKNKEELKNYNIICTNTEEVEDCLKKLEDLGFKANKIVGVWDRIVYFYNYFNVFQAHSSVNSENDNMNFYQFGKLYKRLKAREDKKEQEPKTLVEYLQSKPIEVKIDNRQDYDNLINYLDEQGIVWDSGNKLSEYDEYYKEKTKYLTFWYEDSKDRSTGLMYSTRLNDKMESITVRDLFKKFNIEYKKSEDLIVDKNGKVLKINNPKSDMVIYYCNCDEIFSMAVFDITKLNIDFNSIDAYISKGVCRRAMERKRIENKLRLLAFELNGNRDIDYNKEECKYYIYYDCEKGLIRTDNVLVMKDMDIYCYSEQFKDEAIKLIGELELEKYLKNC